MDTVNIDFEKLQQAAIGKVAQTALYLGLGINAANNPTFKEYQLSGITPLQFLPSAVDENTLADYKSLFSRWIVGCGFRGLIELFSVLVDEIYRVCLIVSSSNMGVIVRPIDEKDFKKKEKNFSYNFGLEKKLTHLKNEFDVGIPNPEYFTTINHARNCLTHRLGIVGTEDCGNDDKLVVKWRGFDIYAESSDGTITPLQPMPANGVFLEGGGKIKMNWIERIRKFPQGSLVLFSPAELAEICLYVNDSIIAMIGSAQKYAVGLGLPVAGSTKNETKAD
ncbi:MAG: hypothetical protein WCD72_05055 [Dehalococcoidia bacterium]